jgi:hypothetical protein
VGFLVFRAPHRSVLVAGVFAALLTLLQTNSRFSKITFVSVLQPALTNCLRIRSENRMIH